MKNKVHQLEDLIRFIESKVAHLQFNQTRVEDEKIKERIKRWKDKILDLEDDLEKIIDMEVNLVVTSNDVKK